MKKALLINLTVCLAVLLAGCGHYHRRGLEPASLQQIEGAFALRAPQLSRELEGKILALDPSNVTAQDIHEVLVRAPAPRIINIHGGIAWVIPCMVEGLQTY